MKEESPEEIAGFVRAARAAMTLPAPLPKADLDWSSYAGKRRQRLPWYILPALMLARSGVKIFMHGAEGHTAGRIYTREVLQSLGIRPPRPSKKRRRILPGVISPICPFKAINPILANLFDLRPILGLRSPVHTLSRMINPFAAPVMLQGIFHPSYMAIHQKAALLLGQSHLAVFRGEGGEIERRPHKPCEVRTVHEGAVAEERWPVLMLDPRQAPEDAMDLGRLTAVLRGETKDEYGEAAVTGTLAIALKALGSAETVEDAEAQAKLMWEGRDRLRAVA